MQHGYTTTTAPTLLLGAGVVTIGSTPIGVSRGGLTLEIERTWRSVQFDGQTSDVVGLDYLVRVVARISGTFLEFAPAKVERFEGLAAGAFATAGAGASLATASVATLSALATELLAALPIVAETGTAVASPRPALALLTVGQLLNDVRLVVDRGSGGLFRYIFPKALVTAYSLRTQPATEGEVTATFEAKLEPSGEPLDIHALPYRIERP